ncbi:GGDEF domain-containing protein [Candidatus Daviesbacteria bacterium]|nr:GGDEF domain-containing protein [Candidatus Daviesbacteria bacterium]
MDQKSEMAGQIGNVEDPLTTARAAELNGSHREEWRAIREGKLPEERYVAEQTARALEQEDRIRVLEEANERLKSRVTVDPLVSSVSNHGYFLELLDNEVESVAKTAESSSALITLDLDRFKATNESLGHAVADRLLIDTGQVIVGSIRPGDSPGRTGGDEFSIILRRIQPDNAISVAQRVRDAVISQISKEFPGFSQSVSIGVCAIPKGLTAEQVRSVADAALYTVKNNGRNQVAVGRINPNTGSIETTVIEPSKATLAHT